MSRFYITPLQRESFVFFFLNEVMKLLFQKDYSSFFPCCQKGSCDNEGRILWLGSHMEEACWTMPCLCVYGTKILKGLEERGLLEILWDIGRRDSIESKVWYYADSLEKIQKMICSFANCWLQIRNYKRHPYWERLQDCMAFLSDSQHKDLSVLEKIICYEETLSYPFYFINWYSIRNSCYKRLWRGEWKPCYVLVMRDCKVRRRSTGDLNMDGVALTHFIEELSFYNIPLIVFSTQPLYWRQGEKGAVELGLNVSSFEKLQDLLENGLEFLKYQEKIAR